MATRSTENMPFKTLIQIDQKLTVNALPFSGIAIDPK